MKTEIGLPECTFLIFFGKELLKLIKKIFLVQNFGKVKEMEV
jgi:hypothetical protein